MELLVYKASAGSGKTFTLAVEYIKHLIINPRAYRYILAVTFTNKATGEMKERILHQLYGIWQGDPTSEAYLNRVHEDLTSYSHSEIRRSAGVALLYILHDYSRFRIETIDSFFQSVMNNLARELELSPNLNIELDNAKVLGEAVDSLIEKLTPTSPTLAWLLDYINERIADDKRWNVSNEIKRFGWNIFDEGYIERGGELRKQLQDPNLIKNYRKELQEMETEAMEQMKGFYDQFEGELESSGLQADDLKGGSKGIGSYFRKLRDGRLSDKDVLNVTLSNCLADASNWSTKTSPRKNDIIQLAQSSLLPLLQDAEIYRSKNNKIVNSCRLSAQHLNKLQLLANIDEEVRTLNKENNRFLLSDTNALLHNLMQDGDSSFVFEKIGASIRNVMIDEFQDTSRMQWDNFRILLLEGLSQGADSLIVGDVKQSIYRWRNGDWGILNTLNVNTKSEDSETGKPIILKETYSANSHYPIFPFPVRVENLKTNRRSETNIIRFNNRLFIAATQYLNSIHVKELDEDCIPLQQAYADVEQESPRKNIKGYVKTSFLEPDEEHDYTEQTLIKLGEEVQQLLVQGVRMNDITILVRKNKNIPFIANYFDKSIHIPIVSDEAFRLDASTAICMLIDALHYISNPEDRIARASLISNYILGIQNQKAKANSISNNQGNKNAILIKKPNASESSSDSSLVKASEKNADEIKSIHAVTTNQNNDTKEATDWNSTFTTTPKDALPEAFYAHLDDLRLMPLYELLEELFCIFQMNNIEKQDAYLFSFFDAVTEYLQNNSSDIDAFLRYWDETLCSKTIPSGETEGIRILSIHKSKGLEFHTVLLPFCDWKIENETNNQLVWCAPSEAPYNALDIVPVNYSSTMAESVYRKDYLNERLQLWVDNLNLLYVAFTRASKNLIIWSKKGQKGTMAELLYSTLPDISGQETGVWDEEAATFELGKLCPSEQNDRDILQPKPQKTETATYKETNNKEHKDSANANRLTRKAEKLSIHMESMRHEIEFRQSNRSADFIAGKDEEESDNRFINRGKLLHTLFSAIQTEDDIDEAINQLVFEGIISNPDTEKEISRLTRQAFNSPQIKDWYSGSWQLFTECEIIWQENGTLQTRRPDRVMMRNNEIIVVDFKFGKENKKYNQQVQNYMHLLSQMGYPAKNIQGYLWYVTEGRTELVTSS